MLSPALVSKPTAASEKPRRCTEPVLGRGRSEAKELEEEEDSQKRGFPSAKGDISVIYWCECKENMYCRPFCWLFTCVVGWHTDTHLKHGRRFSESSEPWKRPRALYRLSVARPSHKDVSIDGMMHSMLIDFIFLTMIRWLNSHSSSVGEARNKIMLLRARKAFPTVACMRAIGTPFAHFSSLPPISPNFPSDTVAVYRRIDKLTPFNASLNWMEVRWHFICHACRRDCVGTMSSPRFVVNCLLI
jgi:hypothetical protein